MPVVPYTNKDINHADIEVSDVLRYNIEIQMLFTIFRYYIYGGTVVPHTTSNINFF